MNEHGAFVVAVGSTIAIVDVSETLWPYPRCVWQGEESVPSLQAPR